MKTIAIVMLLWIALGLQSNLQAHKANCDDVPALDIDGNWEGSFDELVDGYCDQYGEWVHRLLDWYWWKYTSVPQSFETRALRSNALANDQIALPTQANFGQKACIKPKGSSEWVIVEVADVAQLHHATSHVMYSDSGLEISTNLYRKWQAAGYDEKKVEFYLSEICPSTSGELVRLRDWFRKNAVYVGGFTFDQTQAMSPAP